MTFKVDALRQLQSLAGNFIPCAGSRARGHAKPRKHLNCHQTLLLLGGGGQEQEHARNFNIAVGCLFSILLAKIGQQKKKISAIIKRNYMLSCFFMQQQFHPTLAHAHLSVGCPGVATTCTSCVCAAKWNWNAGVIRWCLSCNKRWSLTWRTALATGEYVEEKLERDTAHRTSASWGNEIFNLNSNCKQSSRVAGTP